MITVVLIFHMKVSISDHLITLKSSRYDIRKSYVSQEAEPEDIDKNQLLGITKEDLMYVDHIETLHEIAGRMTKDLQSHEVTHLQPKKKIL